MIKTSMSVRPSLRSTVRRLLLGRAVRAIGQGILITDLALYLHALGWRAAMIGGLLTGVFAFSVTLTALAGWLSDRFGRRVFVLGYDLVVAGCAIVAWITAQSWALVPAIVIGGFGRGGTHTPFAPAEQAWLSDAVPRRLRGHLYSTSTALGLAGLAVGALLGILPDLSKAGLPDPLAYRPLFVLVALSAAAAFVIVWPTRELRRYRVERKRADAGLRSRHRDENRLLMRLTGINALNGLGIGLTGPLIAYWFNLRFGLGPGSIAPVMALAFAAAALASLGTGRLTLRVGVMRAVIGARALALILLLALPLAPSFAWAAALHVIRMALNMGTIGARQGLNIGLVGTARRGVAASVSSVSILFPQALGPALAGILFAGGALGVPFYLAAALQAAYLVLYNRSFRAHDPARPPAHGCQRTRSR